MYVPYWYVYVFRGGAGSATCQRIALAWAMGPTVDCEMRTPECRGTVRDVARDLVTHAVLVPENPSRLTDHEHEVSLPLPAHVRLKRRYCTGTAVRTTDVATYAVFEVWNTTSTVGIFSSPPSSLSLSPIVIPRTN